MTSVVIVGAGAMGCLFGARLAEAGADVTLVDVDRQRLEVIARDGLELVDDNGRRTVRLTAAVAEAVTGPIDLVLLFTKGNHSGAAVRSVAHLAAGRPVALTLQNGIGNAEILGETFGAERVLMGTAHVPADMMPPNIVVTQGYAQIHFGGFAAEAAVHAPDVAALLTGAGFEAAIADRADVAVWEKLAFNAALNALAMVAEATNGEIDNPPGLRLARAVVSETVAVAQAKGIPLDGASIEDHVVRALADHAGHKASMLQDREAGRPTEIEFINGAVAREGAALGVPTPVTVTLADLVRLIESRLRSKKAVG